MKSREKAVQQKTEPADEAAEVADEDGVDGVALTVLKVIAHNRRKGFGSSRRSHCLQPSVLRLRRLPQSCSCLLCEPRRDRRTRCLHSQGEHHYMPRSGLRARLDAHRASLPQPSSWTSAHSQGYSQPPS